LLRGEEVASTIHFIAPQPPHVHICDTKVKPASQGISLIGTEIKHHQR